MAARRAAGNEDAKMNKIAAADKIAARTAQLTADRRDALRSTLMEVRVLEAYEAYENLDAGKIARPWLPCSSCYS